MKRLIGITGAFLLIYVIGISAMAPAGETASAGNIAGVYGEDRQVYTAREEDGRIVIRSGEELVYKTDTRVGELPKIDRMRLREGISLYSDKELKEFLEDYCS